MTAAFFGTMPYWAPPFLFVGHWFADWYKIRLINKEHLDGADESNPDVLSRLKWLFHVDQAWHLVQLLVVSCGIMYL